MAVYLVDGVSKGKSFIRVNAPSHPDIKTLCDDVAQLYEMITDLDWAEMDKVLYRLKESYFRACLPYLMSRIWDKMDKLKLKELMLLILN